MPVPTSIADLSTTAGSNYPAGGDAIGTSLDDYLRAVQAILAEGLKSLYTAGGTANALTVTTTPIFATLSAGMGVWVKPTSDNSGATTLNVNGLGAISVYYNGVACVGGEIKNGVPIYLKYDGTVWNAVTQGTRFTDLAYTGTLTGGTGVINIGSGQIYKDAAGNVTFGAGTFGYGSGSGGTVTQATSKSTSVTLNKPNGQIIMHTQALAGTSLVQFTLNNSYITYTSHVEVMVNYNGNYRARCVAVSAGTAAIIVENTTIGSLSDPVVLNFCVKNGSAS